MHLKYILLCICFKMRLNWIKNCFWIFFKFSYTFRIILCILFSVTLTSFLSVRCEDEDYLICEFKSRKVFLRPQYLYCEIQNYTFVARNRYLIYQFSGSNEEKNKVTGLHISKAKEIEYLPNEIFNEFPKLNGIMLSKCELPIVTDLLFPANFDRIDLYKSNIKRIHKRAFRMLHNLEYVSLMGNQLEIMDERYFSRNYQLVSIQLQENKIKMMNPLFFSTFKKLRYINMKDNDCIDYEQRTNDIKKLNEHLNHCFDNCRNHWDCKEKVWRFFDLFTNDFLNKLISSSFFCVLLW